MRCCGKVNISFFFMLPPGPPVIAGGIDITPDRLTEKLLYELSFPSTLMKMVLSMTTES
jgi:hypothetical protein